MSVPGAAEAKGRCDRDLAVAGVRHATTRGLTLRAAVSAVAAQAGVSERALWRWLAGAEAGERGTRWRPSEDELAVYALWGANASAAWRKRRDAGAEVPSLRSFQKGIAAVLTAGQRAGRRRPGVLGHGVALPDGQRPATFPSAVSVLRTGG